MHYTVKHPLMCRWEDEHAEALRRLAVLEKANAAGDWNEMRDMAVWLSHELKAHNESEEIHLFPLLERHLPPGFGPTQTMRMEHRQIWATTEALVDALAMVPPEDPGQVEADALSLVAQLGAHIRKEDQVLYPLAERLLADAELAELADVA